MSWIHWTLVVCMYPFILIMYFCLKKEGHDPKKRVYYGVSLSKEQAEDPAVTEIGNTYKKQMKQLLWISFLTSVPVLLIPPFSLAFCYWCFWFLFACFVFFIPFGIANKKLKELKVEKGWTTGEEQPRYTEIKEAAGIRKVKWYHFLGPVVISMACVVWAVLQPQDGREALLIIIAVTFAGMTLMFAGFAFWMDKEKTAIVSSDSNVNVNYARARKNMWKNFWVAFAWFNTLYTVGILFYQVIEAKSTGMFWLLLGLYVLFTVILLVWVIQKSKALEARYADKMDLKVEGDDAHWLWGMLYCNPKDKHTMVNKRVGLGTTINFATPVGKGVAVFLIVTLLSMPVFGIWLILDEFTPIQLKVEENCVVAKHVTEKYRVPFEEVREAELLTELPNIGRNYGTSMDNIKKGNYRLRDESISCEALLNPQNGLFIRLETEDEIYLFSGFDDEETRQVYEAMQSE